MKKLLLALFAAGFCHAATVNICSTATCNGTTNDTAAVQAAINGSSSGDTILWATGTTKLTSQINLLSGRTYQGTGGGGVTGSINNQLFLCNSCNGITVTGLVFTGGGILFNNSGTSNNTVSGNTFQNIITASDYTMDAVHAYIGSTNLVVSGNTFSNIHDSRAVYSNGCGAIWIFDGQNATVTGNTFNGTCQALHYTANHTDNTLTITNNNIHGTQRYSIEVQGSFSVNNQTISGNTIDTPVAGINGQAGISSAAGGTGGVISGNTLYGPNQGNPMNQSDAIEAMGSGFIISGNTAGHWGEAQLIGFSDATWQTKNNIWCDMNYPNNPPAGNIIVLEAGGMSPAVNTGNTYSTNCTGAAPVPPVAPQSVPPSTRPTPTGSVIAVHSGDDLQAKYNAASCGDDLVLDDGATFTGNFYFIKQCTTPNWILIEGTGCNAGMVAVPTYVTQGNINSATVPPIAPPTLTHYAKLTSSNTVPPLNTTDGSNNPGKYNYFGCLEVTASVSQGSLVSMTNALSETLASQLGDHLMFDRLYVHGIPASSTVQMTRGFLAIGSNISIVNNYVSQIYGPGDSQAILGAYGPGPYLIQNNFLSAPTEVVMFGGTGKSPGYSCTIAASPTPTTTTATVNTCIDLNGGAVSTPTLGTSVMFLTSSGSPSYLPTDYATITGNSAGALTFSAIHAPPLAGVGKAKWGLTPNDITVTKNFFYKLPSWNPSDPSYDGISRASKNFLEVKYGKRWLITANAMVNSWNNGQSTAINFNATDQNGDCPWCTASDITFTNNIVKNIAGSLGIITSQDYAGPCPAAMNRVLIQNNLFWVPGGSAFIASGGNTMGLAGFTGCPTTGGGTDSLQIIHNHLLGAGINIKLSDGLPYNFTNLVIRDNLTEFDQYRWTNQCPDGTPPNTDGTACITGDVSTSGTFTISNNAIVNSGVINGGQGVSNATLITRYGSFILGSLYDTSVATNYGGAPLFSYSTVNADYHGFSLTGSGPWRNAASDGTDPGVNFALLDAALGSPPTGSVGGSVTITGTVTFP